MLHLNQIKTKNDKREFLYATHFVLRELCPKTKLFFPSTTHESEKVRDIT